jgi:hypothetical protein
MDREMIHRDAPGFKDSLSRRLSVVEPKSLKGYDKAYSAQPTARLRV